MDSGNGTPYGLPLPFRQREQAGKCCWGIVVAESNNINQSLSFRQTPEGLSRSKNDQSDILRIDSESEDNCANVLPILQLCQQQVRGESLSCSLAGCVTQTIFLSTYLRMAHGDVLSERGSSLPHLAQLTMLVGKMLPSFVHQEVDSRTRTVCM